MSGESHMPPSREPLRALMLPPNLPPGVLQALSALAELYAAPGRPVEYEGALRLAWFLCTAVHLLPLAPMIAAGERADVIGPLLDPTLWLRKHGAASQDLDMLRALRLVQAAMERLGGDEPLFKLWPARSLLAETGS